MECTSVLYGVRILCMFGWAWLFSGRGLCHMTSDLCTEKRWATTFQNTPLTWGMGIWRDCSVVSNQASWIEPTTSISFNAKLLKVQNEGNFPLLFIIIVL